MRPNHVKCNPDTRFVQTQRVTPKEDSRLTFFSEPDSESFVNSLYHAYNTGEIDSATFLAGMKRVVAQQRPATSDAKQQYTAQAQQTSPKGDSGRVRGGIAGLSLNDQTVLASAMMRGDEGVNAALDHYDSMRSAGREQRAIEVLKADLGEWLQTLPEGDTTLWLF
jgi:hypothetical protein